MLYLKLLWEPNLRFSLKNRLGTVQPFPNLKKGPLIMVSQEVLEIEYDTSKSTFQGD